MKNILLFTLLSFSAITLANAQQNALGLRLGFYYGGVAEASFQHYLSELNRVEINLGLDTSNAIHVTGAYQWVFDLSQLEQGFKWYAGVGGGAYIGKNARIGILGNLGIEYTFEFPLQLSLDIRPIFYLNRLSDDPDDHRFRHGGGALGVRYKF